MISILTVVQSFIFLLLALLHFHWALGGSFGYKHAIPTKENGDMLMNPGRMDGLVVGLGLLAFGIFYLVKIGWVLIPAPSWVMDSAGWLIAGIFILRALGDFKYVGFFKKLKSTEFGIKDTQFYSPLCLYLGIVGLILA